MIEAGQAKLAIVGMDLGRGPTPAMMDRIRQAVAPRGIANVLICGSHTHHGPVIELTDQPGFGKGKFDDAVAYAKELPERIIAAILEADANRRPARIGVGSRDLGLNRNRHTKRAERPTDPRLTVIRFDRPGWFAPCRPGPLHGSSGLDGGRGSQVLRGLPRQPPGDGREGAEGPLRLHPGRRGRPERQSAGWKTRSQELWGTASRAGAGADP